MIIYVILLIKVLFIINYINDKYVFIIYILFTLKLYILLK